MTRGTASVSGSDLAVSERARVAMVADALVGGLGRFPDALPFIYILIDSLTAGLGMQCEFMVVSGGNAVITSLDVEFVAHPDTTATFGVASITVAAQTEKDAIDGAALIRDVHKRLRRVAPSQLREMEQRIRHGCEKWQKRILSISRLSQESNSFSLLEPIEKQLDRMLDGYRTNNGLKIDVALTSVMADGRQCVFGPLKLSDNIKPEIQLQKAVLEAAATGFCKWSSKRGTSADQVFSVPCVVGDVPWAIFYCSFARLDWGGGTLLYRDVLPRLLEHVRQLARTAYVSLLLDVMDEELAKGGDIGAINARWEELARVFPFTFPQLKAAQSAKKGANDFTYRGAQWVVQPVPNRYFLVKISDSSGDSWGDISELQVHIERSIEARLRIARFESSTAASILAQDVSHEFKNLTQDIAVLARGVSLEAGIEAGVPKHILDAVQVMTVYARQLNAISLALFELTSPEVKHKFRASDDACPLLRAAIRVMLELRAKSELGFVVEDEVDFDDAIRLLASTYGRMRTVGGSRKVSALDQLGDLIEIPSVTLLLFAASEPVRNIRVIEHQDVSTPIKARTRIVPQAQEVVLVQETIEAVHTPRTPIPPSRGAERVNRLLPQGFCQICPSITPRESEGNFTPATDCSQGVVVIRETHFVVSGRPFPERE